MCNNGCCDIICTNLACDGHHYVGPELPSCRFAVTVVTLSVVCHGLQNSDLQPRKAGGTDHMTHVDKQKQVSYILLNMACIAIMGHHGHKVSATNVGGVTAQYLTDTQRN